MDETVDSPSSEKTVGYLAAIACTRVSVRASGESSVPISNRKTKVAAFRSAMRSQFTISVSIIYG